VSEQVLRKVAVFGFKLTVSQKRYKMGRKLPL